VVLGASGDFNVTRGTTATRVNANGLIESVASGIPRLDYYTSGGTAGCPALLVEPSAQNLLLRSAELSVSGTWSRNTINVSADTETAPDNTLTAETLQATASFGFIAQSPTLASGSTATYSVFVKNVNTSSVNLQVRTSITAGLAGFSFSGGVLVSSTLTNGTSRSFENYGNGWYRLSLTCVTSEANQQFRIQLPASGNTIYAWGAQVETGSVATSYIPTTAAPVTRNADVINLSGAVSGCIGQTEGTIYAEVDFRNVQDILGVLQLFQDSNNRFGFAYVTNALQLYCFTAGNLTVSINAIRGAGIYKLAAAYANNDWVFYVNGTQIGTDTSSAVPTTSRIDLGDIPGLARFNNRIRAAALYTTRLTNAELAALTTL
jgi:hypothetical protein